jgi:hypothetical protein
MPSEARVVENLQAQLSELQASNRQLLQSNGRLPVIIGEDNPAFSPLHYYVINKDFLGIKRVWDRLACAQRSS